MNPWAGLIVLIAIGLFVIAYKGTQDNVISAVLGRPYGNSGLNSTDQKGTGAPTNPVVGTSDPATYFPQTGIHEVA